MPHQPSATPSLDPLGPADVAQLASSYREQGFVVLPDALPDGALETLRQEGLRILRGDLGGFSGQVDLPSSASDQDVLRNYLCIHQPHKLSAVVSEALAYPAVIAVLRSLIGPNIKAMQSMFFIKSEGKPGQAWHQDEHFIPTRDRSLTAAWMALDDATVDNGCLWALPGSHRRGVLYPDREQDDARFDATNEAYDFPYDDDDAVPVEVKAGSVVFFNGYLLHRSLPNTAAGSTRRALVNHYCSAETLLPWGRVPDGVTAAVHDYRDVVLVAGEDPYAYKGASNIAQPSIRPDR